LHVQFPPLSFLSVWGQIMDTIPVWTCKLPL
jgi:hypothetical protein